VFFLFIRGAARIFLRGGAEIMEAKAMKRKIKLLVIRIARKAHILWINS